MKNENEKMKNETARRDAETAKLKAKNDLFEKLRGPQK